MIDSININPGVVRPVEKTLPSEINKGTAKAEASAQQDTANISAASREHAVYMAVLQKLPDVRSDLIQHARYSLRPTVDYPPLDVVNGIAKLMGTTVLRVSG